MRTLAFFCCLVFYTSTLHSIQYSVTIEGATDKSVLSSFQESSQTYSLIDKEPPTIQALKRRIGNDLTKLKEIATAFGYLDATSNFVIDESEAHKKVHVIFHIHLGPEYTIEDYRIVPNTYIQVDPNHIPQELPEPFASLRKESFLQINSPLLSSDVQEAEIAIVKVLLKKGYARAKVVKKQVYANNKTKKVSIVFFADAGQLIQFGEIKFSGNSTVSEKFIKKKITLRKDDSYHPEKIEETQELLEKTGLFSSVLIKELPDFASSDTYLPLEIQLQEAKHRSIGMGASYTTTWGPGVTAEWEHRNMRGTGQRLLVRGQLWHKFQTISLNFVLPEISQKKDLSWNLEAEKLDMLAYDSTSFSVGAIYSYHINQKREMSWGNRLELLQSKNFEGDNTYYLYKVPFHIRWSTADSLLDPKTGWVVSTKLTPTLQFSNLHLAYVQHLTSFSFYMPLMTPSTTFASKILFGNIFGAARKTIPPPDRFYGGTENSLRGYKAQTVSPLHKRKTPIGGRSLMVGTFELRSRFSSGIGSVLFYELGNVFTTNVPRFDEKFLHSCGIGIRYSTPIGPIRFDFAVPLNPRKRIDPAFQIYFSIGQSF